MKRFIASLCILICVFSLSLQVAAEEVLEYTFDNEITPNIVTNTLADGGNYTCVDAITGKALSLNGSYGIYLGEVGGEFSVSAMVKITSMGGTDTIFFKNMGDSSNQKWTGVLSNAQKADLWTHGDGFGWSHIVTAESATLGNWSHVCYVEKNAVGSLYLNGELIGSDKVAGGNGKLYLGSTYWSSDAPKGLVDNIQLYNYALTANEVDENFGKYAIDMAKNFISVPKEVVADIKLPVSIGTKSIVWNSDNEQVLTSNGILNRADEDKMVTLTAEIDGEVIGKYDVLVLKKPAIINGDIILSYTFDENDTSIVHDKSGNGNHAAVFGNMTIGDDGAVFDGVDDYVQMPNGVINNYDNITIVMKMKPSKAQQHTFAFCFGNGADKGYIFLNPSRPDTNAIWFSGTKTDYKQERSISSIPGIRRHEWTTVCVAINERQAELYIDGELVMDGYMGVTVSDLGNTDKNYIAKSLYDGDAYFGGIVSEFTVYSYTMDQSDMCAYKNDVEYAPAVENEDYITGVNFEDGLEVTIDTYGRNDVKIGAVVLDENNNIIEYSITNPDEKINLVKSGTVCVFAFNEEDNIPGNIYVKGYEDDFSYEYIPGKIAIISNREYERGMVIVAGYDIAGTLTGVSVKICDIKINEPIELSGEFQNAVNFKMLYWNDIVSMIPHN